MGPAASFAIAFQIYNAYLQFANLVISESMNRTYIIILLASYILAGCQSEFDKCMDTELPRAEVLADIEAERTAGKRLGEVRDLTLKIINVDKGIGAWDEENPLPSELEYPLYNCSGKTGSAWKKCYDNHNELVEKYDSEVEGWKETSQGKVWVNLRVEEVKRLVDENRLSVTNESEYEVLVNSVWDSYETILEPWSTIYECYEDSDCEDWESLNLNIYDTLERSFDEAILNRATALSRLLETTKELATVTCNNNGFYE